MKLYLVGGTPRSRFLGDHSSDFDFAVEASSYEAMLDGLRARGVTFWQERPEFVTVRGLAPYKNFGSFDWLLTKPSHRDTFPADFTLCRAEAMYSDKRHPDKVTPADLETDLARRDFTVNAMAVSEDGTWHDPFGGTEDASAAFLRTVGAASLRFDEDPLRMLRAVRFAVKYDMQLHDDVVKEFSVWSGVRRLESLPTERVKDELNKALAHDWHATMTLLMVKFPLLGNVVHVRLPLWFKATMEGR